MSTRSWKSGEPSVGILWATGTHIHKPRERSCSIRLNETTMSRMNKESTIRLMMKSGVMQPPSEMNVT